MLALRENGHLAVVESNHVQNLKSRALSPYRETRDNQRVLAFIFLSCLKPSSTSIARSRWQSLAPPRPTASLSHTRLSASHSSTNLRPCWCQQNDQGPAGHHQPICPPTSETARPVREHRPKGLFCHPPPQRDGFDRHRKWRTQLRSVASIPRRQRDRNNGREKCTRIKRSPTLWTRVRESCQAAGILSSPVGKYRVNDGHTVVSISRLQEVGKKGRSIDVRYRFAICQDLWHSISRI